MNGMNGMNVGLPMNAGHQMDLNVLFNQVEELSQLLKENREKTQAIIASAEELAVSHICYVSFYKFLFPALELLIALKLCLRPSAAMVDFIRDMGTCLL